MAERNAAREVSGGASQTNLEEIAFGVCPLFLPLAITAFGGSQLRDGETTIKIKFAVLKGGAEGGERGKSSKTLFFFLSLFFRGKKSHDNKILNVQILLSRNFVVVAQALINAILALRS